MGLDAGARLGPYEILAPLGAGGMGEVYKARDTRLDRTVAIKLLPQSLAEDQQFRARFDREARVISQLDHPHICALYDLGTAHGTAYLVMQYLEGDTLAARLQRGTLPLEQTCEYAAQIAAALARAHGAGVVHRDLKPGNVMLTRTGARLLDFGLATAMPPGAPAAPQESVPTTPASLTAQGTILGTFPYMAPEQLEGADADARTDIWAFGCVLYEMVTGRRPFEGKSQVGVLSAILEKNPEPVRSLRPAAPAELERLIATCLEKDPARRRQSAHDLALQLQGLPQRSGTPDAGRGTSRREAAAWSLAAIALLALLGGWLYLRPGGPAPRQVLHRTSVLPPPGVTFSPHHFAVSPDGTRLAFAAFDENGRTLLWIRSLVSGGVQQLPETDDAQYPFWAPDSARVGFFARGQLRIADVATGAVRPLVEAPSGRGAAWSRSGDIVYAPSVDGPLLRVSEQGGPPQQATRLDPQSGGAHRWPCFLPDGRRFLYVDEWGARPPGLYAGSLDGGEDSLISTHISGSIAYGAGHILYVQDGNLTAQPFHAERLTPSGSAVPILHGVLRADSAFRNGNFSISATGVLVVQSMADAPTELVRYIGSTVVGVIPVQGVSDPAVSPDGRLVAFSSTEPTGRRFIGAHDLERGVTLRVTQGGAEAAPVWSRDGRAITYRFEERNTYAIYEAPVLTAGPPQLLLEGPRMTPVDYSPDGDLLAFMTFEHGAPRVAFRNRRTKEVSLKLRGAEFQFHPDGQWVSYVVLGDMYLARADGAGQRIPISSGGGGQVRWSRDGRRLYYLALDRKLMEVPVEMVDGQPSVGAPRPLFQTRIVSPSYAFFQYDIRHTTPTEFIVNSLRPEGPLAFVSDWTALLPK